MRAKNAVELPVKQLLKGLFLAFVDDIDARSRQGCGNHIFPIKRLVEEQAGTDGTYYGNERVPDDNLSYGITSEQLVVDGKAEGRDENQHQQDEDAGRRDLRQGASHQETCKDEQQTAEAETVTCAYEHVDSLIDASGHQTGKGTEQGIENNHAVAQKGEGTAVLAVEVQGHDTQYADGDTQYLAGGHLVALEEDAGKNHHREDAHGVENGGAGTLTVRETDVESSIVEGGVEQGEHQQEKATLETPLRGSWLEGERPMVDAGKNEDDGSTHCEAQTGKEHLTARHVLRDGKLVETQLHQRVGPAPEKGGQKCKQRHPKGALKDACVGCG